MQPGDLIKTTRWSVGVPKGTLALIVNIYAGFTSGNGCDIWEVQLLNGRVKRYLAQDLEIVENESW